MSDLRVDPELLALARRANVPQLSRSTLEEFRQAVFASITTASLHDLPSVARSEQWIRAPDGRSIRVLLHAPKIRRAVVPAILHMHGGGFVCGTPEMKAARNARLSADLGCVVASPAYRLAPETQAPGNVEDCLAAFDWLRLEARTFGIDPEAIVLLGESAGGGLAASLALLARDRGLGKPAGLFLQSPMLDDRTGAAIGAAVHRGHYDWDAAANRFGWNALLGDRFGGNRVDYLAAPARAADLSGLPPSFIAVGDLDLFLDEDVDFARRTAGASVPTELHVYPGAFHGFEADSHAEISRAARQDLVAALRRCLNRCAAPQSAAVLF